MPEGDVAVGRAAAAQHDCLTAAGATGAGVALKAPEDSVVSYQVDTDGGADANLTVLFVASNQQTEPSWDAAITKTNHFSYIQVIDIYDGSSKNGNVGSAATGSDIYKDYEANVNGFRWYNAIVSARSAGEVTVKIKAFKAM